MNLSLPLTPGTKTISAMGFLGETGSQRRRTIQGNWEGHRGGSVCDGLDM